MFAVIGASFESLKAATPVPYTGVYAGDTYKVTGLGAMAAGNIAAGS